MKKLTLKQGVLSGAVFASLCLGLYLSTAFNNESILSDAPKATEEVTSIAHQTISVADKHIASSKKDLATLGDEIEVAYETPKTFPNGPFAPSIRDTEIDGSLKADANGNLIIDIATRDLFDYFLNTVADVSPEVAVAELEKLARASLPENTVVQAMNLLGDYLLYKETALEYSSQPLIPEDQQDENYQLSMLEASFQTLKDIRRSTMSDDAVEAFFGLEETYGEFTLASIKIQKDPNLTPEQMQLALQTQRELLPEVIRNTENRMLDEIENSQTVNQLLLSDQNDNEIESALRDNGLSEEAINEALDYRKQQRQFEDQYALYQAERNQLLSAGLSEEDMITQKERLLQKYFHSEQTLTQAKVKDLNS